MLKRLYVGCVSLPSSIACLAVFHCPVVGVVAEWLNMPRMFVNFPAAMASTVWLRENGETGKAGVMSASQLLCALKPYAASGTTP